MAKDKITPFNAEAGRRLAGVRIKLGFSQEKFAEILGVSRGAIGNYERGSRGLDGEFMGRLKNRYRVTSDYLLFGDCYGAPPDLTDGLPEDESRRVNAVR